MCIAIVKTKEGHITDDQLKNCFKNNPDGAGVAYSINGQLYMIKGIFNADTFIKSVRYAEGLADGAILIHCRIATSGLVDEDNCHPHVVHYNCVMIHNGVLDIDVPKGSLKSDTVLFVDNILRPLHEDFMFDDAIMNLIKVAIGSKNKFCFLHSSGAFAIVNEEAGDWIDGVWYSNTSYEERRIIYYGNNVHTYTGDALDDELLSADEWMALEEKIYGFTPMELAALGPYPVYDYNTKELRAEFIYDAKEDFDSEDYLMDVDEYLYNEYTEVYDSAMSIIYEDSTEILR